MGKFFWSIWAEFTEGKVVHKIHDQDFLKMKRSNGIELFNSVLKKYGKWFLKCVETLKS